MLLLGWMRVRSLKWALIALITLALLYMSWPKFELFQCRSVQSEAKAWLTHLYEAEKFYYAHHHQYASLEMLLQKGLVKSSEKNYTYHTFQYDTQSFEMRAISKNLDHDIWSVNQTGKIRAIHDACPLP